MRRCSEIGVGGTGWFAPGVADRPRKYERQKNGLKEQMQLIGQLGVFDSELITQYKAASGRWQEALNAFSPSQSS